MDARRADRRGLLSTVMADRERVRGRGGVVQVGVGGFMDGAGLVVDRIDRGGAALFCTGKVRGSRGRVLIAAGAVEGCETGDGIVNKRSKGYPQYHDLGQGR